MINFTGGAAVCGIIGNPVSQSLSPLLHRIFAAEEGRDFVYVPLHVRSRLKEAIAGAHALGIRGMNITKPHKQEVIDYITVKDPNAALMGAVNTLLWTKNGYEGYNTDFPGLLESLREAQIQIEGKDVVVLGAGGAARAVFVLAMREKARSITVFNRTEEKAKEAILPIAGELGFSRCRVAGLSRLEEGRKEDLEMLLPEREYIAFQTTGIGMHPDVEACAVKNRAFYEKIYTGIDLIYTPAKTRFLQYVEESSGGEKKMVLNGLGMLIYQGVISYKLWNPDGVILPKTVEKAKLALFEALQQEKGDGKKKL